MNDFYVTSIPFIGSLGTLLQWALVINALLIGLVIFFAYRAAALRERVDELEEEISHLKSGKIPDPGEAA